MPFRINASDYYNAGSTDSERIQAAIDSVQWTVDKELFLDLSQQDVWFVDTPIKIVPQLSHGRFTILPGAWVQSMTAGSPAFILGETGHKVSHSTVSGVRLEAGTPGALGWEVGSADDLSFTNCQGLGVKTTDLIKYLSIDRCFFSATEINCNVGTIRMSKFQQTDVGLKISGAMWRLENIDCSFCMDVGLALEDVTSVYISGWTEKIGPSQPDNNAAALSIVRGRNVRTDMLLNCVFGSTGSGLHAAVAARIEDSHDIRFTGGYAQFPTRYGLELIGDCTGVSTAPEFEWIPDPQITVPFSNRRIA